MELRAGKDQRERMSDQFGCKRQGGERGKVCVVVIASQGDGVFLRLLLGASLHIENKLMTVAKR